MKQKELIDLIARQYKNGTMFRSNLFICNSYRLREFILNEISEIFNCEIIRVENKADTVRTAVKEILSTQNFQVYSFLDFEQASSQAKNALLKVCEENKHKIIFVCSSNIETVPSTLVSRCQVLDLQPFSQVEISNFLKENFISIDNSLLPFVQNLDDIDDKTPFKDYYDFSLKILSAFKSVSLSNILKSSKQVKTSQTATSGFELSVLVRIMSKTVLDDLIYCKHSFFNKIEEYYKFIEILSTVLGRINIKSSSKSYLFDQILIGGFLLCN